MWISNSTANCRLMLPWFLKWANARLPGSKVAYHANVLIFPNLCAANIGYKLVERFSGATCLGPLVQGLAKPVLDLSRGCSTPGCGGWALRCLGRDAIAEEDNK